MNGHYNVSLVVLSILIAFLAAGAFAMGIGICAMHYTGMFARLPLKLADHWSVPQART